jgi:exosortase/archaeosortase family protein
MTRPRLRFVLTFLGVSSVLLGAYYYPEPPAPIRVFSEGVLHGYALATGSLLGAFERGVSVSGHDITGRYGLRLVKTCDAMDATILLLSAIAAWPAPWKDRIRALAISIPMLIALNIVRLFTLYYVGVYLPQCFETAHMEVWPVVMLTTLVAWFVYFAKRSNLSNEGVA